MKRITLLIVIFLIGMTGFTQNKTANVKKGNTYTDLVFTAADTINESETYYIEITNFQDFPAMQDVYLAGSAVSGSGDVVITVYGKKFAASSYSSIGTTTWNSTLALDETITVSIANRYRYIKVAFVADATGKQVLVTDVQFKNWFTGGNLSTSNLTLSGALSVGTTLTVTGESTFNNHINLGAGDDVLLSSTSDITVNTDKFTVAGATGNTAVGGTLGVTGVSTLTGGLSFTSNVTQFTTLVTLTATEIVGTAAGDVGHADGAILVAAPGTGFTLEFVSAFFVYDYATAAYTGGADDVVVQVGVTGTQVAVTGAVTGANLLEAATDAMLGLGSTVTELVYADNGAISLFGTEITQPGTAAGVLRCYVTYNVITTGL